MRDVLPFLVAMIVALAHHIRARNRALAAAPLRLPGLIRSIERTVMTKPIYVLNGPISIASATREPEIYGTHDACGDRGACAARRPKRHARSCSGKRTANTRSSTGCTRRSTRAAGIIINPAAFTFTSMALLDALKMFPGPIIELHITNIHRREPIYHKSYVSPIATAVIAGLGTDGYPVAVKAMLDMIANGTPPASV